MRKRIFVIFLLISQLECVLCNEVYSPSSASQSQIEAIQKLAELGNPEAQFQYAMTLQLGMIVPSNMELAAQFLERAARQNHSLAAGHLGTAYVYGRGVEIDYEKGFHWIQVAANLDNQAAQTTLSGLYLDGMGTSKNYSAAYFWALVASSHSKPIQTESGASNFGANLAWRQLVDQATKLANVAESKLDSSTIIQIQSDVQLYKKVKHKKPLGKVS